MTTVTGEKTMTNTSAAVFAGESVLANRVFLYVRNLDDCVQIKVNGSKNYRDRSRKPTDSAVGPNRDRKFALKGFLKH